MTLLCILLAGICFFDYLQRRIPNMFLVILFLTGVGWHGLRGHFWQMFLFAMTAASVMLILYPLFKIGCIGAGDIKLFGVCAGYMPLQKIFVFLFVSLLIAAIFSLMKLLITHHTKERLIYFGEYVADVLRSRKWYLYFKDGAPDTNVGIRLSGPIFLSVLMHMGGVY